MNWYLNYYRENECTEGDNRRTAKLTRRWGLSSALSRTMPWCATPPAASRSSFVRKYQALPTAEELQGIICQEQHRLEEASAGYANVG